MEPMERFREFVPKLSELPFYFFCWMVGIFIHLFAQKLLFTIKLSNFQILKTEPSTQSIKIPPILTAKILNPNKFDQQPKKSL